MGLDAYCLGKLVLVLGAHGILKLPLEKELLVPAAGRPEHAARMSSG